MHYSTVSHTHKVSYKEVVQTYQQAQEFVYGQCDECHGEGEIHPTEIRWL